MATDDVQTNIRIPAALKERLVESAQLAGRSLSAEVAYQIERAYSQEIRLSNLRKRQEIDAALGAEFQRQAAVEQTRADVATAIKAQLEAELNALKTSRQSDIAAAVQFFSEKAAAMTARAKAAETALEAQKRLTSILSEFVVTLTDLVPASQEGSLKITLGLIRQVGATMRHGDLDAAIEASQALVGHGITQGLLEQDGRTHTPALTKALDRPKRSTKSARSDSK